MRNIEGICKQKAIIYKTSDISDFVCKASSPSFPHGSVEGYLSTFDNIDSDGDVIRRGSWGKSIRERVPTGRVPLMKRHFADGGGAEDVIGTINDAKEDAHGLFVTAAFSPDRTSQEIREKVAGGHIKYFSAGFRVIGYNLNVPHESGKNVNEFTELALAEGTITPRPANDMAIITRAKALRDIALDIDAKNLEGLIREIEALIDAFTGENQGKNKDASQSQDGPPAATLPAAAQSPAEWMEFDATLAQARARLCEIVAEL